MACRREATSNAGFGCLGVAFASQDTTDRSRLHITPRNFSMVLIDSIIAYTAGE
jgi:hypothetical protein